jgi:NHLM bacteriocin system ABC transporter peptidase/ATP-binding protein
MRLPWQRAPRRISPTPVVMQMEALECGAVALAILLRYHGRHESVDALRVACGVGRNGAKISNLLKAARGFGLEAHAWSTTASELPKLDTPFMVFWNFNHFVVVEGFDDGLVYLNDPASGRRQVDARDFAEAFAGVVLTFAPGPSFKPQRPRIGLFGGMLGRLTSDRPAVMFAALTGLFLVVPGMVMPVFTTLFVDRIVVDGQMAWFLPILLGLLVSTVLEAGLSWLQGAHLLRLQYKLSLASTSRFFWHVLHLPVLFFAQRAPAEVASRMKLNESAAGVISGDLARALINGGLALFFVIVMLTYDVLLTSISVLLVMVSMTAFRFAARVTQDLSIRYSLATGRLQSSAANGIAMIETLHASADDSHFFTKHMAQHAQVVLANQHMETTSLRYGQVPAFLMLLNGALILVIGGWRVIDGHLTIGMLIAFQGLVYNFSRPMSDLFQVLDKVQHLRGDLQRLDDVLGSAAVPPPAPPKADAPTMLSGAFALEGLRFAYGPQDPPLFDGLSMSALAGERIGIVGSSGSGKSSLARLLAGVYQMDAGTLTFDGHPAADIGRAVRTANVAHVDQDIQFFEGTIRENLTLWDASLSESQMVRAAKDAMIHDYIAALPDGYDTPMQENGRNLSGGERQRLELARALCGNPRILLLDEATSSVDAATEAQVLDHCRRRGCTTLVISHRPFVLRSCDRVLVLAEGRIVEQGQFEALFADPGSACRRVLENA